MIKINDLAPEKGKELLDRLSSKAIVDDDYGLLAQIVESHMFVCAALKKKNGTIRKLGRMLFGAPTEKASKIIDLPRHGGEKDRPKGHGRNGASTYTGAEKIAVPHTLKAGDRCPGCDKGRVYPTAPGVIVRITGGTPLQATSFELEKLRCNLCGEVFTAAAPDEAGQHKYDETAGAMLTLLKYGSGLPFHRIAQLQESMGVPLPASTQWDIVERTANRVHPIYRELIRQAAQGKVIHNDDTTMRILAAVNEGERRGTFTTGMLSLKEGRKIALFFTGHKHAGENMTDLLAQRTGLDPPIQMCDALSRNTSKEFAVMLAHCLAHARRNFVDETGNFPDECRHVIEVLAEVYKNDAHAKFMSLHERLMYHQTESGPLMDELRGWITCRLEEKKTEPNSGLGKAFTYMLKHWEPLTLFLKVEGAPIDNNVCEQVLKRAILHRKNSLFYRTLHGAYIGDLFMSLIHTCRLSKVNPFHYLVALQRHSAEVFKNPREWMPWNYKGAGGLCSY